MKEKWVRTACPRNCYSSCGFYVAVVDGKISGYKPDPDHTATPEGMCLKGQSYLERVYSNDRLRYPLIRNSKGSFQRIPYREALEITAEKLKKVLRQYGSQSVLYYAGSGMAGLVNELAWEFWKRYGGVTTTYGNLCWPAGLEATRLTLGDNKHNDPADLENARLIILWGKNSVETNIHEMLFVDRARTNGAEIIVIDPRMSPTARKADLVIQPKPSTDGALALGIARFLIREGLIDEEFVNNHVLGFEQFAAHVQKYTPEYVASVTGVPEKYQQLLASKIGHIKPMTLVPGYGIQRYSNGGQTMRCLLSLPVITGNIGKKGACWHFANLQSYIFDKVKEPDAYYPPPEPGSFRYSVSKAKLGDTMRSSEDPPLRAAWIERGNPVTQNPDTHATTKALKDLDFIVVIDQFLTDTAKMADIIFPAKSLFEQTDVIGSYWHSMVQLKPAVIEPPGEVRPESSIYHDLWSLMFSDENPIPATDEEIVKWLQKRTENGSGNYLQELKQGPVIPTQISGIAFEDLQFPTSSGKIELYSETAADRWKVSPLPEYVSLQEPESKGKTPFYLQTPNTKNRIHSQFGNLKVIKSIDPEPVLIMNPEDAESRGIASGGLVRVSNQQGEIFVRVRLDPGILPGVVSIPNGIWVSEGACPNLLSYQRETDMGFGAAFHDTRVNVEKWVQP